MPPDSISQTSRSFSIIDMAAIILTSILLGAITNDVIAIAPSSLFWYDPSLVLLFVLLLGFGYWILLRKLFKKNPENVKFLWPLIILAYFGIYQFLGIGDKMYPAHISTQDNGYEQGETLRLSIIPDVSDYHFRRVFTIPLTLTTPSGNVVKRSIEIEPDCFQGCIASRKDTVLRGNEDPITYGPGDWYVLQETGKYTLNSTNPIVKGATFEVYSKEDRQNEIQDISKSIFPEQIGVYHLTPEPVEYSYGWG